MSDLQQLLSGGIIVTPPAQVKTRPVFLSQQGKDLLKRILGFRPYPFDPFLTSQSPPIKWRSGLAIGYGRFIHESEWRMMSKGITEQQASEWLDLQIAPFEVAVRKMLTVELEQHQFDALVLQAHQMGLEDFNEQLNVSIDPSFLERINTKQFTQMDTLYFWDTKYRIHRYGYSCRYGKEEAIQEVVKRDECHMKIFNHGVYEYDDTPESYHTSLIIKGSATI